MFDLKKMGFIRVGTAVPKVQIGDPMKNIEEISKLINQAAEEKVKVLVFPELCVTGYTCGDLFHQRLLLDKTEEALEKLVNTVIEIDMVIAVGLPILADNQLFNCAVILYKGEILGAVPKTFIPNYNEFYEKRWFSSAINRLSDRVILCGQEVPFHEQLLFRDSSSELCIGVEVCEDLWMTISPSAYHAQYGANLILNLSASNEVVGKKEYRDALVSQQSAKCLAAYVYVSAGQSESTTDVVFGGQTLIAENGSILEEQRFQESVITFCDIDMEKLMNERRKMNSFMNRPPDLDYTIINFNLGKTERTEQETTENCLKRYVDPYPFVPGRREDRDIRCQEIFTIQLTGLAQRLVKSGIKKAVLGISGGLDSTLALLVCKEAFDKLGYPQDNIIGVTMPGFGTTNRTNENAKLLMRELGIDVREIPITEACLQHFAAIGHDPAIQDITYENVQARERTQILMDLANREGGIVVGTGDLSELALGWCTYNGDHMSNYAVNAGIPKTLVKYLVSWYADTSQNTKVTKTLQDILATPISPELLPADRTGEIEQKTEEKIGSYDLHDFFLYHMMRWGYSPKKIFLLAELAFQDKFDSSEILRWLKVFYQRFFSQQFKRSCLPDGPKVGSVCLSPRGDWRMPSDASAEIWLKEVELLEKNKDCAKNRD
ncbi:NH(3)-dependent NAD(+) synthetase [Syntrophobotulus glycolicus DSM 8271]|uniref:Glutamine-dependent NAD(+) synthetase n=1 Tax=Syntrophobotulus glycolicus (strain DSM 8271 / FlGlyR) TaxID=645991 RepID=F0SZ16_SYNGF|nr:NAD(+) synthase [Syntrophobotulus glycolicus]ADY57134.1 NH(3)-dependent NAD(+) synthetase [Syntrophobotulus glycolicus DSM 8271]